MNTRKTLIIISGLIVIALFALTSYISYNFGMNYGVENAELIREQRAGESEKHSKNIKSVLAIKVVNKEITNQIYSTGRVLSVNSITISSEVQGKILNNSFLKKGTKIKRETIYLLFKIQIYNFF